MYSMLFSILFYYRALYNCRSFSRHRIRLVFATAAVLYSIDAAISWSLCPSAHNNKAFRQFSPSSSSFCLSAAQSDLSTSRWITDLAASDILNKESLIDNVLWTLYLLVVFFRNKSTHLLWKI